MLTLRSLPGAAGEGHQGEVFSCAYTPDGAFILSGGWDGFLRLWEASSGRPLTALRAGPKALSACAASPDGRYWLSGSMEGLLSVWDAVSHQSRQNGVAHIRPISAIRFSPDGQLLATTSWDRQVVLRQVGGSREGATLAGHTDIVTGCAFTPDGKHLVSWSHDTTLRLWEVESSRCVHTFRGHPDRVSAAALSPDGRWLASASRDGTLKLWDFAQRAETASLRLAEPRWCSFLLDASTLVTLDAVGTALLLTVSGLEVQAQLATGVRPQAADLSPGGSQVALGGEDGRVHRVAVDGSDQAPLVVTPTRSMKEKVTVLGRLFGKHRLLPSYDCICPACRHHSEFPTLPREPFACPNCRQPLRADGGVRQLQPQ
jgi:WD40 repeat protein